MSLTLQSFSLLNPNPSCCGLKKSPSSSSLRFRQVIGARGYGASPIALPKGLSGAFLSLHRRSLWTRPIVTVSASQEDPVNSNVNVEHGKNNANSKSEESPQETLEQLKIKADKAWNELSVIAKVNSKKVKEYISIAAQNSPEPVKEDVETFNSSVDDLNDVSQVRDFHVGIPYGLLLTVGGFLSFMVTGSISAIRFGVILGGILLFLSVSSLRSYTGESSPLVLKGQAAITSIIFLRELLLVAQRSSFPNLLPTFVSGAVVAFYFYRIVQNGKHQKDSNLKET